MRTAGIRNKPVDRRYLSDQDKNDYNQGAYGKAAQAVSRTRAYRGQIAYQQNRPPATVTRRPGTGALNSDGKQIQQQRLAKYGAGRQSDFKLKLPSSKGDLFKN